MSCDQHLYAMQFPSGDVKYVMLIGELHIEDKAHLICGSGWGEAGVFTCGGAVSMLDDNHNDLWALGMHIKFHWWPSISFSHMVIPTNLKNYITSRPGKDVGLSTLHLLSS